MKKTHRLLITNKLLNIIKEEKYYSNYDIVIESIINKKEKFFNYKNIIVLFLSTSLSKEFLGIFNNLSDDKIEKIKKIKKIKSIDNNLTFEEALEYFKKNTKKMINNGKFSKIISLVEIEKIIEIIINNIENEESLKSILEFTNSENLEECIIKLRKNILKISKKDSFLWMLKSIKKEDIFEKIILEMKKEDFINIIEKEYIKTTNTDYKKILIEEIEKDFKNKKISNITIKILRNILIDEMTDIVIKNEEIINMYIISEMDQKTNIFINKENDIYVYNDRIEWNPKKISQINIDEIFEEKFKIIPDLYRKEKDSTNKLYKFTSLEEAIKTSKHKPIFIFYNKKITDIINIKTNIPE